MLKEGWGNIKSYPGLWILMVSGGRMESCCEDRSGGSVNVTEELNDLLRVYEGSEHDMLKQEKGVLNTLELFMEKYLEVKNARCDITKKKEDLREKLGLDDEQEEEDEE